MAQDPGKSTRTAIAFAGTAVVVAVIVILVASLAIGVAMGDRGHRAKSGFQQPVTTGADHVRVDIRDWVYYPEDLTIETGTTVTWVNEDRAPHSATDQDGAWDTGLLKKDESETLTFDTPGEYEYYCTLHPSMIARLAVQ